MKSLSVLAVLYNTVSNVNSHSWVECTDYQKVINGQDYDESACEGYTRSWSSYATGTFALDRGNNYQPGGEGATDTWCGEGIGSPADDYASTYNGYPMAEYVSGGTYRVVWPAKNHANYECFGNIPDASMKLYYNANPNPSADPSTLSDWTLVKDWHDGCTPGQDECGFQNCPDFCDNTDGAVCYGDFTLDPSLITEDGIYTFMWYWAFNGDGDIYTNCYEARVSTEGEVGVVEEGDGGSSTANEFLIQVPICYEGSGDYDVDTLLSAAESLFPSLEWTIAGVEMGNGAFNATLQTFAGSDLVEEVTAAAVMGSHELCDAVLEAYGIGECESCTDVLVYSSGSQSNEESGDPVGSAIVAVVVVLVIVLVLIGAGVLYQKMQAKKTEQGAVGFVQSTSNVHAVQPVTTSTS